MLNIKLFSFKPPNFEQDEKLQCKRPQTIPSKSTPPFKNRCDPKSKEPVAGCSPFDVVPLSARSFPCVDEAEFEGNLVNSVAGMI